MPTVFRFKGYRFEIYPNDHTPPHVHVSKAGGFCRITIGQPGIEAPLLMDFIDLNPREIQAAIQGVAQNQALLLTYWSKYHD